MSDDPPLLWGFVRQSCFSTVLRHYLVVVKKPAGGSVTERSTMPLWTSPPPHWGSCIPPCYEDYHDVLLDYISFGDSEGLYRNRALTNFSGSHSI